MRVLLTEAVKGWDSRTGKKSREGAAALRTSLGEDLSRVPATHAGCTHQVGFRGCSVGLIPIKKPERV